MSDFVPTDSERCLGTRRRRGLRRLAAAAATLAALACGARSPLERDDRVGFAGASSGGAPAAGKAGDSGQTAVGGNGQGGSSETAAGSVGTGGSAGAPDLPRWRMSAEPFCVSAAQPMDALKVWSDDRGVFVLIAAGTSDIYFNAGSGWAPHHREARAAGLPSLTGFRGGPLVYYGTAGCSIRLIEDGASTCSGAPGSVQHLFAVSERLAYAVYQDRLLRYDGSQWRQLGAPLAPPGSVQTTSVWANADIAVVGARESRVYLLSSDSLSPVAQSVPAGDYLTVWGFAPNDIWAGTNDGQLVHYDGASWRTVWQNDSDCSAIRGMWGEGQTLFFHTRKGLYVQRSGQKLQQLLTLPCESSVEVTSVWGTNQEEVFVGLYDGRATAADCAASLRWFNGRALSPL